MKFSIIVPAYNASSSLSVTLDSILNQRYKNYEVVVVNDGSTDKTKKVIESYCPVFKNIIYIYQENSGVSVARNTGVSLATGEYILFLDADDTYEKNYLYDLEKKIKECDLDVIYTGFNIVESNTIKKRKTIFTTNRILEKYIKNIVNPHLCSIAFKRDYIKRNRILFPENKSYSEDVEFVFSSLLNTSKIGYLDGFYMNYFIDENISTLSSFSFGKIESDFESIKYLLSNQKFTNHQRKLMLNYRLNALLTNKIEYAINHQNESYLIMANIIKYNKYILKLNYGNGLRSLKINIKKIRIYLYYLRNK